MNVREKLDELPRVPALLLVGLAFLAALMFLLLFSGVKLALTDSASGNNQLPTLAPVPPPANFVDRSQGATMRVEGFGDLDPEILMLGGASTIKGKVVRPGGATTSQRSIVELARWEGERFNTLRVTTNFDGTFEVKDLRGGRWSARGWEPPKFPSREAGAWFLGDAEELTIELTTGDEATPERRVTVSPAETTFDAFTVTVVAVDRLVDENGRLADRPVEGIAAVSWPFNYTGESTAMLQGGSATFNGRCVLTDSPVNLPRTGSVRIGSEIVEFVTPTCAPRPTTTTTLPEPPPSIVTTTTTTTAPSTTSTTVPPTIIGTRGT
jgi:hypothetical protein